MITVYVVYAKFYSEWGHAFNYLHKGDSVYEKEYFSTREKAENWVKDHANLMSDGTEAKEPYQMPKFEIKEWKID